MKAIKSMIAVTFVATSLVKTAQAAYFEPDFSSYFFPGNQYTIDATVNTYFSANYGITIDNAYLYRDSRDTFDGIGVANGEVPEIGTPQSGRINFIDTTDFVTIDLITLLDSTVSVFTSGDVLVDTFTNTGFSTGSYTLNGGVISYLTWSGLGGYAGISGLRYNYDGTTDGTNDDIGVPAPATLALIALGLLGVTLRRQAGSAAC